MLGGSRALGTDRPDSDWDLGLYYRSTERPLDPHQVRELPYQGHVSELGEWGPIVNGGAWLSAAGIGVDVLFRDLDLIEGWVTDARQGRFEVLVQNGYVVGAPTYLPVGELAICCPIAGRLPRPEFPPALARSAPPRWLGRAGVSVLFAHGYARVGDTVCCVAMLADAILCAAHARLAERREWVLNEKLLVQRAGLDAVGGVLAAPGETAEQLGETVATIAAALGVKPPPTRSAPHPPHDRVADQGAHGGER